VEVTLAAADGTVLATNAGGSGSPIRCRTGGRRESCPSPGGAGGAITDKPVDRHSRRPPPAGTSTNRQSTDRHTMSAFAVVSGDHKPRATPDRGRPHPAWAGLKQAHRCHGTVGLSFRRADSTSSNRATDGKTGARRPDVVGWTPFALFREFGAAG